MANLSSAPVLLGVTSRTPRVVILSGCFFRSSLSPCRYFSHPWRGESARAERVARRPGVDRILASLRPIEPHFFHLCPLPFASFIFLTFRSYREKRAEFLLSRTARNSTETFRVVQPQDDCRQGNSRVSIIATCARNKVRASGGVERKTKTKSDDVKAAGGIARGDFPSVFQRTWSRILEGEDEVDPFGVWRSSTNRFRAI